MSTSGFEQMLTGGHPNSLGRTVEVVERVRADPPLIEELFCCYRSEDEVVRLRTSSAMKRLGAEHPDWLVPYLDRFLTEVAAIPQPSAQWTLAQLFRSLRSRMSADQVAAATQVMQRNLDENDDWIVQNHTMQTLFDWSADDVRLLKWLSPRLERLSSDRRKSVAARARKLLSAMNP